MKQHFSLVPLKLLQLRESGIWHLTEEIAHFLMKIAILFFSSTELYYFNDHFNLIYYIQTIFYRKYTQSNCIFECELKIASDRCQCVPWDYPQLERVKRMPICDRFGRECFTIIMTNASLGNTCDCPLDCETIR